MTTSNDTGKKEESNDIPTKHILEISMLSKYQSSISIIKRI